MPLTILCKKCGTVLYNGPMKELTFNRAHIDDLSVTKCPGCGVTVPQASPNIGFIVFPLYPTVPEDLSCKGGIPRKPTAKPLYNFQGLKVGEKFDWRKVTKKEVNVNENTHYRFVGR